MNDCLHTFKKLTTCLVVAAVLAGCQSESPESLLNSAKEYMQKHDDKAAIIQLKNVLQKEPDSGEARLLLGQAYFDVGQFQAAEIELQKAEKLQYQPERVIPLLAKVWLVTGQGSKVITNFANTKLGAAEADADLLNTLGQAYLFQKKIDLAKAAFQKSQAALPDYAPTRLSLAKLSVLEGHQEQALSMADAILEKTPSFYEAWMLKGDLYTAIKQNRQAIEAYQKVLSSKPDFLPALSALCLRYIELGQFDKATEYLTQMEGVSKSAIRTHFAKAMLLFRQGKLDEARDEAQILLKKQPENTQSLQLAGAIEFQRNSLQTASSYLEAALPKSSDSAPARRLLVATYLRLHKPEKALEVLTPILEKTSEDANLAALAGDVYMQNGQPETANQFYEQASQLDPKSANKKTSVALSLLALGETDAAYRELEKASLSDQGTRADMVLIADQIEKKRYSDAFASIDNLSKKTPRSPVVEMLRAKAYLAQKDVAAARQAMETAQEYDPAYFPAASALAKLDIAQKNVEQAKQRFATVLEHDAGNIKSILAIAGILSKEGKPVAEVAAQIEKAVLVAPKEPAPYLALVQLYLSAQMNDQAKTVVRSALDKNPDSKMILDLAGSTFQRTGDLSQALSQYEKYAALFPDEIRPYLRMAEIHVASGSKEIALQDLHKALLISPDSLEAQRGILMMDLDAGRVAEAAGRARQIQLRHPEDPAGYILEGDIYALKKDWSNAQSAYAKGAEKTGKTPVAIKLFAAYQAGGDTASSVKFAEKWQADHPQDSSFKAYTAESAILYRQYDRALTILNQLRIERPQDPAVLNNLAWVLGELGKNESLSVAEEAYRLAPKHPRVMDTYASILMKQDKPSSQKQAIELWRAAINMAPADYPIRLNLAKAFIKTGDKGAAKTELEWLIKQGSQFPGQDEAKSLLNKL